MYPALDPRGDVTYFQARFIEPPEGRCKYDNPARRWASNPKLAWTRPAAGLAPSSRVLVVAEGIPDALAAAQAGIPSVGVLGSTYPDRRLAQQITDAADEIGIGHIAICFDADEAGKNGSGRLKELLDATGIRNVTEVFPPEGHDLSEWAATGDAPWLAPATTTRVEQAATDASSPHPLAVSSPPTLGIDL